MWLLSIILVTLSGIVTCQVWDQATLDDFSKNLKLTHSVLDNTLNTSWYLAEIVLRNDGFRNLSNQGNWSLHFDSVNMMEPDLMLVGNLPNPDGAVIQGQGVKVHHVAGTHFRLEPTADFYNLSPGKERTIQYTGANWMIAKTDFIPRWYLAAPGLTAKVLESTDDESLGFVGDFKSAKQWKRYSTDQYNPYTPQYRFDRNYVVEIGDVRLIPSPYMMNTSKADNVIVDAQWKVYATPDLHEEAKFLSDATNMAAAGPDVNTNVIKLSTGDVQFSGEVIKGSPDAYHLKVDTAQRIILIRGQNASGVFYGVQTLLSMMSEGGVVYKTEIWDAPRFEFRGMHLDVARNFRSKEDVKRLLDAMAMYKLNKFHFHLTDDEAWRLQIPGLPELTDVGSKRCLDPTETKCLTTQLGSGPSSTTSGSGHYTVDDYKEILRYAHKRHIQIIPEVDMPGHARSAIKSMEARYKKLKAASEVQKAVEYRLVDDADESRYLSVQMFTDNAINPCVQSVYNFIDHVVQQIKLMHQDIQPLKIFHFGGDEVANGAWTNSAKCRQLQNTADVDTAAIKEYFFKRVTNITMKYGLDVIAWEDGVMRDGQTAYDLKDVPNAKVYANTWNNVWEWGSAGRAYTLANNGYQVVMSQATHLYFDHPYEPDPAERGYYWAPRFIDTQKTFGFMPKNLYGNIDVRRSGIPLKEEEVCLADGSGCPPLTATDNIVGMQGHLWSETARTSQQMDFMIFPRMLALAERAWHQASWESQNDKLTRDREMRSDWEVFARAVGRREFGRLDKLGVKYRIPPPGAKLVGDVMKTTSGYPGLDVQYSTDNGKNWNLATDDVIVKNKTIMLRTRSADKRRFSRAIIFNPAQSTTGNPIRNTTAGGYVTRSDVVCSATSFTFAIPDTVLPQHNVTLRDPACVVVFNGSHYVATVGLNDCGTTVQFTKDSVIFRNELSAHVSHYNFRPGPVSFGDAGNLFIPVECVYPRRANVSMAYLPLHSKLRIFEKRYGHLDFELTEFSDDQFQSEIPSTSLPKQLPLNQELHIKLSIGHSSSSKIGIYVDNCLATPTPSPNYPVFWPLLKNGCSYQPELHVHHSSSLSEFLFSFNAFKFVSTNPMNMPSLVYVHCQVSACYLANCATSCQGQGQTHSRRRRGAMTHSSHLVSTGPFILLKDQESSPQSAGVIVSTSVAAVACLVAVVAVVAWRINRTNQQKYHVVQHDLEH